MGMVTVMEAETLEVEMGLETESEMMVSNWPGWIIVGDVVQLVNSLYAITSFMQTVIHVHWSQNSPVVMVNATTIDLINILPFKLSFRYLDLEYGHNGKRLYDYLVKISCWNPKENKKSCYHYSLVILQNHHYIIYSRRKSHTHKAAV